MLSQSAAYLGQNEGNSLYEWLGLARQGPGNSEDAVDPQQQNSPRLVLIGQPRYFPGEHIGKETPVPIPNTVVKLSEPMIVQQTRK